jgi:hypothetical protein
VSTPFSRSLRALETDHFQSSIRRLILIGVLMIAWLGWFFLAPITRYEVSETARFTDNLQVIAYFPPLALGYLRPGQLGQLRLDGFPSVQYSPLPVVVETVDAKIIEGHLAVTLTLQPGVSSTLPQPGLTGQVAIESGHLTPVDLLLQAAGRSASLPASPTPVKAGSGSNP